MSECQVCHCEDATVLEFCDDCYTEMKAESDAANRTLMTIGRMMMWYDPEVADKEFLADVFEIAFGDDAINRDFSYEEVLERLREFSDKALENEDE